MDDQSRDRQSALARLLNMTGELSSEDTFYAATLGVIAIKSIDANPSSLPHELKMFADQAGVTAFSSLLDDLSVGKPISEVDTIEIVRKAIDDTAIAARLNDERFRTELAKVVTEATVKQIRQAITDGNQEVAARLVAQMERYTDFRDTMPTELRELKTAIDAVALGGSTIVGDIDQSIINVGGTQVFHGDVTINYGTPSIGTISPRHLKVFFSSPGDLPVEREIAADVIDELNGDPFFKRSEVTLELVVWEQESLLFLATNAPYDAAKVGMTPPSQCDIVAVVLWSRMGTPLPSDVTKPDGQKYLSHVEWEYLDALTAYEANGTFPKVIVYRCTQDPTVKLSDPERDEKFRQFDLVEEFFKGFYAADGSTLRGYNEYEVPDDFRRNFERHLRLLIHQIVQQRQ